jgi:hypothetical protein
MRLILPALLLLAAGCATSQQVTANYNIQFEPRADLPEKIIRWVVVDDVAKVCQSKMPQLATQRILACSEYNNRRCTIYTGRTTDMAQVGHEIRHCFEGQWHQ